MPSTSTYIPSKVYKQQLLLDAFQSISGVAAVWPMMRMGSQVAPASGGLNYYLSEQPGSGALTYGRHASGGPYVNKTGTSYLYVADAAWNSPAADFSVAGYVKFAAAAAAIEVISAKWESTDNQRSWNMQRTAVGMLGFNVSPDGTLAAQIGAVSNVAIGTNWTFVAASYKPSTEIRIFINTGVWNFTSLIPATIYDSTSPLKFGAFAGNNSPLTGEIGIFGLYNTTVPDATITALYNATKGFYGL